MDTSTRESKINALAKVPRQRVQRACDQCRRRKARCDGLANCSACKCMGLSCSYGHSVKQARGPSYVAYLEKAVAQLQSQCRRLSGEETTGDQSKDSQTTLFSSPTLPVSLTQASPIRTPPVSIDGFPAIDNVPSLSNSQETPSLTSQDTDLTASCEDEPITTYIDILACEPRAKLFGVDVLRQLCNLCYDLPSHSGAHRQDSAMKIVQALDAPVPHDTVPTDRRRRPPLPSSNKLLLWVELAFFEALILWEFVDKAYIYDLLTRTWNSTEDEGAEDDLALLYSVLALGQRLEIGDNGPKARSLQGLNYFEAARDMVPLSNCERSIPALQTMLCMALYLMAGSSLTKYHAYVSAAVSASLRMGLYEHIPGFSEEEQALRHRLWLSVHAMDVYASSALGLPSSFAPVDLHAWHEREQAELPGPTGVEIPTEEFATAAYQQLACVLYSCLDRVYHRRGSDSANVRAQVVTSRSIQEASEALEAWEQNYSLLAEQLGALALPVNKSSLNEKDPVPLPQLTMCTRRQLLVYYAYCQAWLLLYTPFVHHLVQVDPKPDSEGYLYGTRCMRAALATVHVAEELKWRFQLNEAYFQTVDVLVNALMVLLAVQLGSADAKLLQEAIPAGRRAKTILMALTPLSIKASQCWEALAPLYESGNSTTSKPRNQGNGLGDVRDIFASNAYYADGNCVNPVHIWNG